MGPILGLARLYLVKLLDALTLVFMRYGLNVSRCLRPTCG
jgi:hypothetical protein